jgi:hypothetical protein
VGLGVHSSISATSLSSPFGSSRCVPFGLVHRSTAVADVHPCLGLWFLLPLRLLLEVAVVVPPVLSFSSVVLVRFVNLSWFGISVLFGSSLSD